MNGTQWQLQEDYHNYTLDPLKTPEMQGYSESGNDCTLEPKKMSYADQYHITMENENTVSQW